MKNCKHCIHYQLTGSEDLCTAYNHIIPAAHAQYCQDYCTIEQLYEDSESTCKDKYNFDHLNDCRLCKHYSEEFLSDENHTENYCNLLGHCCFSTSTEAPNCPCYKTHEDPSK